jgi:hypothetical protein
VAVLLSAAMVAGCGRTASGAARRLDGTRYVVLIARTVPLDGRTASAPIASTELSPPSPQDRGGRLDRSPHFAESLSSKQQGRSRRKRHDSSAP